MVLIARSGSYRRQTVADFVDAERLLWLSDHALASVATGHRSYRRQTVAYALRRRNAQTYAQISFYPKLSINYELYSSMSNLQRE